MVNPIKQAFLRVLIALRAYPNILFVQSPGKMYEFSEMMRGVKFTGKESVLDFGCGAGMQALIIGTKCGSILGLDSSDRVTTRAQPKSELLRGRINSKFHCGLLEEAGLEDESFDKVFSFCVIEHIPNYEEVLRCIHRLMKKGGEFIFNVDSLASIDDPSIVEKHRVECEIAKYFEEHELRELLEQVGFTDIEIRPMLKSDYAQKLFIQELVTGEFGHGPVSNLFSFIRMKHEESRSKDRQKGLFLLARCRKSQDG